MKNITLKESQQVSRHWNAAHWYYKAQCIQKGKGICDFIISILELTRDVDDLPQTDKEYEQFQCNEEYSKLAASLYCSFSDQIKNIEINELNRQQNLLYEALNNKIIFDKARALYKAWQYLDVEETDVNEYVKYCYCNDKDVDAIIELIQYFYLAENSMKLWEEDKQ